MASLRLHELSFCQWMGFKIVYALKGVSLPHLLYSHAHTHTKSEEPLWVVVKPFVREMIYRGSQSPSIHISSTGYTLGWLHKAQNLPWDDGRWKKRPNVLRVAHHWNPNLNKTIIKIIMIIPMWLLKACPFVNFNEVSQAGKYDCTQWTYVHFQA